MWLEVKEYCCDGQIQLVKAVTKIGIASLPDVYNVIISCVEPNPEFLVDRSFGHNNFRVTIYKRIDDEISTISRVEIYFLPQNECEDEWLNWNLSHKCNGDIKLVFNKYPIANCSGHLPKTVWSRA